MKWFWCSCTISPINRGSQIPLPLFSYPTAWHIAHILLSNAVRLQLTQYFLTLYFRLSIRSRHLLSLTSKLFGFKAVSMCKRTSDIERPRLAPYLTDIKQSSDFCRWYTHEVGHPAARKISVKAGTGTGRFRMYWFCAVLSVQFLCGSFKHSYHRLRHLLYSYTSPTSHDFIIDFL